MARWTNGICAAALCLVALAIAMFLPDAIRDYAREPEDVWLAAGLLLGSGLLAGLYAANAAWSEGRSRALIFANAAAILALAAAVLALRNNTLVLPIGALCMVGPAAILSRLVRTKLAADRLSRDAS